MGACITRCLPLYSDPRYQPVRSRYLIQDDVVQAEPSRTARLSASSDESLCMDNPLESADCDPFPADSEADDDDDSPLPADPNADPPLLMLTPGLTQSPLVFVPLAPPHHTLRTPSSLVSTSVSKSVSMSASNPVSTLVSMNQHLFSINDSTSDSQGEDQVELTQRTDQAEEGSLHHTAPRITTTRGGFGYVGAGGDERNNIGNSILGNSIVGGYTGGFTGEQTHKWWGAKLPGSLPSLAEVDSPPTASLDLEWEPEAGLARDTGASRESLGTGGEEEASQTAESSSWVPRSACSTPNSLEWDFRASTLSLRGQGEEEEAWQMTSDQETEQLLYEIEQLAARALADTGHGLQPHR